METEAYRREVRESGIAEGRTEALRMIENGASVPRLRRAISNYTIRADVSGGMSGLRLSGRADGIAEIIAAFWDDVTGTWIL